MSKPQAIAIELSAVIVSMADGWPRVITTGDFALPSGRLEARDKKLEQALRAWVAKRAGLSLGYVEQLYTFADKGRSTDRRRIISIGYLALTRDLGGAGAVDWYAFFPWEDRRTTDGNTRIARLRKELVLWSSKGQDSPTRLSRRKRIDFLFPRDPAEWDEELVLQRYELLWEAALVEEARRANRGEQNAKTLLDSGTAMQGDHRRILATAIARLRSKIKYRPVVFELLPQRFTLLRLQNAVESLAGLRLHKQNFRRLVLSQGIIEETKDQAITAKGRPAMLFSFRREIMQARALTGTKLPRSS